MSKNPFLATVPYGGHIGLLGYAMRDLSPNDVVDQAVRVENEIYRAKALEPIPRNSEVKVVDVDGEVLTVIRGYTESEMMRETWLFDGSYCERLEQWFRRKLYHGRTLGLFKSDSRDNIPFDKLTLPEIVKGVNIVEPEPWQNALKVQNCKPNTTIPDEFYMGFPKAHHRMVIVFDAFLPTPPTSGYTFLYYGICGEVNSGGAYAGIASLTCTATSGKYWLSAGCYRGGGRNSAEFLPTRKDLWARYALVYDPPYLEFWEQNWATGVGVLLASLDMGYVQGKFIPAIFNESTGAVFSGFLIGNMWIYELEPSPIEKTQTWTNPATNPSLTVNTGGRKQVELWAQSITAAKTVLVQNSQDGTTWRDVEELATGALNGINQVHKGYLNASRYVKATIEETGTGTEIIELTVSRD